MFFIILLSLKKIHSQQIQHDISLFRNNKENILVVKNAIFDKNFNLWIYSENGIYQCNNLNYSLKQIVKANYWGIENSTLYCDHKNRIWFANDQLDNEIKYIHKSKLTRIILPDSLRITSIIEDKYNKIWIATRGNGCLILDQDTLENWTYNYKSTNEEIPSLVYSFFKSKHQELYLVTRRGLAKWDEILHKASYYKLDLPSNVQLTSGACLKDSLLILGTWGHGVYTLNVNSNRTTSGIGQKQFSKNNQKINSINSFENEILISTWGQGIILYKNDSVYEINNLFDQDGGKIYNLIKSKNDNYLIIQKDAGIIQLNNLELINQYTINKSLKNYNFLQLKNNEAIICGEGGIEIRTPNFIKNYLDSISNYFGATKINESEYLLATFGSGIYKYSVLNNKTEQLLKPEFGQEFFLTIEKEIFSDSIVWAGTLNGLFRINHIKKVFYSFPSFRKQRINRIKSISSSCLIINSENTGLSRIDPSSGQIVSILDQEKNIIQATNIHTIDSNIYFTSTDGFIYQYNKTKNKIKAITRTPDQTKISFIRIKYNKIIVGNESGLLLYDMENKQWIGLNKMLGGYFKQPAIDVNMSFDYDSPIQYLTTSGIYNLNDNVFQIKYKAPSFKIDSIFAAGEKTELNENNIGIKYTEVIDLYFSITNDRDIEDSKIQYKTSNTSTWTTISDKKHIQISGLSIGKHPIEFRFSSDGINWDSDPKKWNVSVKLPWYLSFTFYIYLFLFLTFLMFAIYRRRIAIIKKEEKQKTEIARQQAELEMKVLRAQMNPHFLFNALNSIHNCILQKDTLTAASSLTKFSRLVRKILEHSMHNVISLQSELEALELYMQVEQIRFSTKFNYTITVEETINKETYFIPPLLLQPFVENSIWHGLMPSKNIGEILIDIRKKGDHLHVVITDNGIGRKRASEIKNKEHNEHTSHGISITKDRLNVFNNQSLNSESFTIIDLYNDEGDPTGTQVEFDLAIQKDAA